MQKPVIRDWVMLAVFVTAAIGLLLFHRGPAQAAQSRESSVQNEQVSAAAVVRNVSLSARPAAPKLLAMAPDFSLEGLDGVTHSLSDYRGKPVVLNFWASWCGPCRAEASALVKTAAQYKDKATVVAVNLTASDDESAARSFASDQRFAFPVLLDRLGTVGELYRIRPIPTTLFIDAQGVVADEALGALGEEEFARRIEALLKPADRG
ncbi:TlpA family protein disulfide reductase [Cohnella ginsengisoli]|uniref:TlpA family protein disulfide reductase n=1 Tax=Cohnella ginsengisoli TaxID=425004 RepID=A0A9X4KI19_9BACL|nr:TlpA disulfide reductase family protein [Cohnella ginsengisoli]MDG0792614.1 TlpA family protein disulfide reductase [Cohnella ginsengisoli]